MKDKFDLLNARGEILYNTVSDIIDGRFDIGRPSSPDYINALVYGYAIQTRSISRIVHTFKDTSSFLEVDPLSIEATLEDLCHVYGVYIPGGDQLLPEEYRLIEELNMALKQYQNEHIRF
jgi:hypothetical protein